MLRSDGPVVMERDFSREVPVFGRAGVFVLVMALFRKVFARTPRFVVTRGRLRRHWEM